MVFKFNVIGFKGSNPALETTVVANPTIFIVTILVLDELRSGNSQNIVEEMFLEAVDASLTHVKEVRRVRQWAIPHGII
jgi:hypothetical protein